MDTPNPGTEEAIAAGCTCPVEDNAHGAGVLYPDGKGGTMTAFWYSSDCPVHGALPGGTEPTTDVEK